MFRFYSRNSGACRRIWYIVGHFVLFLVIRLSKLNILLIESQAANRIIDFADLHELCSYKEDFFTLLEKLAFANFV